MKILLIILFMTYSLIADKQIKTVQTDGDFPKVQLSDGSSSNTGADQTSPYVPIQHLMQVVQWPLILKELEITLKPHGCEDKKNPLNSAIGLEAKMIEMAGFFESSQKPLYFPFADITLSPNKVKFSYSYEKRNSDIRAQSVNVHYIQFPILGILFKKKLPFMCLKGGTLALPYLSEFDVTSKQDFLNMKFVPQMVAMFSPDTLISTIFDCVATEGVAAIHGYSSSGENVEGFQNTNNLFEEEYAQDMYKDPENQTTLDKISGKSVESLDLVRNTLYFIDGCNGFSGIGTYADGQDIITDGHLRWHTLANMLHGASALTKIPILQKQTNFNFAKMNGSEMTNNLPSGIPDTMCKPADFMLYMPSENVLQQSYPVVGSAKEEGQAGMFVSTAKNRPGGQGNVVFNLWQRRDYAAFAYFCPEQ